MLAAAPALGATYYVAPDGNNRADGLTESTPWQTVEHAMRRAGEDSTIILLEGVYDEELRSNRRPPNLTMQGQGLVQIVAQWRQSSINNLTLRNLQFDAGLTANRGEGLKIENCIFPPDAPLHVARIEGVVIRHSLLLGEVDMRQSSAIDVAGCIFGERVVPRVTRMRAVSHSNHNSFVNISRAWRFGPGGVGARHQFSSVAGGEDGSGIDRNSIEATPEFEISSENRVILLNPQAFAAQGPDNTNLGPLPERK